MGDVLTCSRPLSALDNLTQLLLRMITVSCEPSHTLPAPCNHHAHDNRKDAQMVFLAFLERQMPWEDMHEEHQGRTHPAKTDVLSSVSHVPN